MTQTAAALSNSNALNIDQWPSSATLSVSSNTARNFSDPDPIKSSVEFETGTFYNTTSQLHYGDKVKFSFTVKENYQAHFILIKGLLEFHRAPSFVFSFDKHKGTFDATTSLLGASQPEKELSKFLKTIAAWVDQEISFKRQLKEMMAFEREYRLKLAKVYAGGDGFTMIRVS